MTATPNEAVEKKTQTEILKKRRSQMPAKARFMRLPRCYHSQKTDSYRKMDFFDSLNAPLQRTASLIRCESRLTSHQAIWFYADRFEATARDSCRRSPLCLKLWFRRDLDF